MEGQQQVVTGNFYRSAFFVLKFVQEILYYRRKWNIKTKKPLKYKSYQLNCEFFEFMILSIYLFFLNLPEAGCFL